MFSLYKARTIFVLVVSMGFSHWTNAAFTQLYSFGDSLSDTGNVFAAVGSPGYPYVDGNFSNGPIWVDLLGLKLGVGAPSASLIGGSNYAWGGARTTAGLIPSTRNQVTTYLAAAGGTADPDALYTIWTGGNDINAVAGGSGTLAELVSAGSAVATIAGDLLAAGAQNILVANVPNLALAPTSSGNEAAAESLSIAFNNALAAGLAGMDVILLDSFSLTQTIANNPSAYGLTNVEDNCLSTTGGLGSACDGYLFWDSLHPTADGHQLIADAAFAAVVPVPAAAWLFGSALIGLGLIKRKTA